MASRILIIDDDTTNATFLSKMLEKRGFHASVLNSGRGCLPHIQNDNIEVLLLDIMMPDLSGIDVLRFIREKYKPVELPIIMVTARNETSDVIEALNLGANDYLTKPVNIDIAVARIQTQINLIKLSRDSLKKKELETLNTMITTYNHEINNPLTIALLNLRKDISSMDQKSIDRAVDALQRIADIVKKIDGLTLENFEITEYSENSTMIDLKK